VRKKLVSRREKRTDGLLEINIRADGREMVDQQIGGGRKREQLSMTVETEPEETRRETEQDTVKMIQRP
jgi:hypothetical protein